MKGKKYSLIIAVSFFVALLGLASDFVYGVEEEGVLEGNSSQYHAVLEPFWNIVINPMKESWYSIWQRDVMTGSEEIAIGFSFWFGISLLVVIFVSFIWSRIRKTSK